MTKPTLPLFQHIPTTVYRLFKKITILLAVKIVLAT